jgi:hypothetical protein
VVLQDVDDFDLLYNNYKLQKKQCRGQMMPQHAQIWEVLLTPWLHPYKNE